MKNVLAISGSDILAGGGLQADLKTFEEYSLFGLNVITSIVTIQQNDFAIHPVALTVLEEQLEAIRQSTTLSGIKIGLIGSSAFLPLIRDFLDQLPPNVPVVLDPVLAFKETAQQAQTTYIETLKTTLFPRAALITPNLKEAELLSGHPVQTIADMKEAAKILKGLGPDVVIKGGGRMPGALAIDLFWDGRKFREFSMPKLASPCVNGAGCTFSSAILSNYILHEDLPVAIERSKRFVYDGIRHGVLLNETYGNVNQGGYRKEKQLNDQIA